MSKFDFDIPGNINGLLIVALIVFGQGQRANGTTVSQKIPDEKLVQMARDLVELAYANDAKLRRLTTVVLVLVFVVTVIVCLLLAQAARGDELLTWKVESAHGGECLWVAREPNTGIVRWTIEGSDRHHGFRAGKQVMSTDRAGRPMWKTVWQGKWIQGAFPDAAEQVQRERGPVTVPPWQTRLP